MTFLALTRPRRAVPPWRRPLSSARPRPAPAPRAAGRAGRGAGPGGLRPGGSAARPARRRHARAGRRRAAGLDPAGRSAGALQHAAVVPRRRQDRRTPGRAGRCRDARPDRGRLDPADAAKNAASARAQLSAAQHQLDYAKQQLDRDRAQARENLIAATQLEQTRNAYASALAQRDQAAQQSALAADQLKYTTLQADHAGVITAERADTGQNVSAGQAALTWPGRAISTPSATCPKACWPAWRWASVALGPLPARPSTPCCARSRLPPIRRAAPTAPSSRWKTPSPRSAWA